MHPRPYIDLEMNHIRHLIKIQFINEGIDFIDFTLQEMCCGFWLNRERWYRKSALPSSGAGLAEIKTDEKMQNIPFV